MFCDVKRVSNTVCLYIVYVCMLYILCIHMCTILNRAEGLFYSDCYFDNSFDCSNLIQPDPAFLCRVERLKMRATSAKSEVLGQDYNLLQ